MAGEAVTVACKIPNGLHLRVFKMADTAEPVMGGGQRTVKRAQQDGETIFVRGPAVPFGQALINGVAGYALTSGVPAEFWAAWKEQNKDHDAVKNGLIFGSPKTDEVHGVAKECESVRSGLEPLMPKDDPRAPRKQPHLSGIEVAEKAA
ncbi:hypothetical protein [Bosea sp. ASV33]|uniref:hypothetical protein n=1 Tax=Bosea sp. ASV33 TaxID=2795106 RepID=UPI0018EDCA06|nr:hypothetical protein [Bosea sp. ASV33]